MAQNKKLIIFIPSIEDGGVEKNLYILLNYLEKKVNKIILITYDSSKNHKFKKNIKIINPPLNFFNFKNRYPKYFLCLISLFKIIIFDKKNLVLSFQANIFAIILCTFLNIKILSRSNSSSVGWSKNSLKQIFFNHFFKKANEIIVNSFEFKKEMDKRYLINTKCILNSFEFNKIKKLSLKKCKKIFQKKTLKIISIGRLTDQKDFLTLLKSIKICKKKNIQLFIIGKGQEEEKLKNFTKKNDLQDKIKFLGYKNNPFNYLKQSDIFILTSIFEGSPNVLIEAQFLKKFIISTDCPTGPKEILNNGKFGNLVKMKDHKAIAKILDNFSLNSKRKNMIHLGFKNLHKYDHTNNCEAYYKLLKNYL